MGCGGEAAAARKEGGRRGVGATDATGGVLAGGAIAGDGGVEGMERRKGVW